MDDSFASPSFCVLVCGGRDFNHHPSIFSALNSLHIKRPVTRLIEGGARGADRVACEWAKARGLQQQTYPADWSSYGKRAGPIRNQQMLADGNPDLVVAFPGGRGTEHMMATARKHGVEVWEPIGDGGAKQPSTATGSARHDMTYR